MTLQLMLNLCTQYHLARVGEFLWDLAYFENKLRDLVQYSPIVQQQQPLATPSLVDYPLTWASLLYRSAWKVVIPGVLAN